MIQLEAPRGGKKDWREQRVVVQVRWGGAEQTQDRQSDPPSRTMSPRA